MNGNPTDIPDKLPTEGPRSMSVREDIRERKDEAIKLVRESTLSPMTQNSLTNALQSAARCTNGFTPAEKAQAMSEGMFGLVELMTIHYISDHLNKTDIKELFEESLQRAPTHCNPPALNKQVWWEQLLSLLKDARRELMWLGLGICALLVFQPQVAQVITAALAPPCGDPPQLQQTIPNTPETTNMKENYGNN